jgi:hypothetical protein
MESASQQAASALTAHFVTAKLTRACKTRVLIFGAIEKDLIY